MTLPLQWLHLKIVHNNADHTPARGRVTFTGPYALRDSTGNQVGGPPDVTVKLVAGDGLVQLPPTNDPSISPQGWTYTVTVDTDAWRDTFQIEIPYDVVTSEQAPMELADRAPATTPTTVATYALLGHTHTLDSLSDVNVAAATNGQLLGKVGGVWVGVDGSAGGVHDHTSADITDFTSALDQRVALAVVDAAGDLLVGSGADAVTRLAKGTDGQVLTVVSGSLAWADPAGGGGSSPVDLVAASYGCKAISMDPLDLSVGTGSGGLKFIAMSSGRLYQMRVALAAGEQLSSVRVPIKAVGAGAGSLWFAVYQADHTLLAASADVASAFTTGSAETWRTVPLSAPADTTDGFVWIVALSTLDTGPQLAFAEIDNAGELDWLLNTSGTPNAVRTEGASALPGTLDPGSGVAYLDCLLGVA